MLTCEVRLNIASRSTSGEKVSPRSLLRSEITFQNSLKVSDVIFQQHSMGIGNQ